MQEIANVKIYQDGPFLSVPVFGVLKSGPIQEEWITFQLLGGIDLHDIGT